MTTILFMVVFAAIYFLRVSNKCKYCGGNVKTYNGITYHCEVCGERQ